MKLHAVNRQLLVFEPHDLAFIGFGGDLQAIGQCFPTHDEGMIPGGGKRAREIAKNPAGPVPDLTGLSVHQAIRPHHFPAVNLAQALVSQAYAQHRHFAGEMRDHRIADARFVRCAGPGRNADMIRLKRRDLFHAQLIIAFHHRVFPQLPKILDQVVGKGIVVIEDKYHGLKDFRGPGIFLKQYHYTVSSRIKITADPVKSKDFLNPYKELSHRLLRRIVLSDPLLPVKTDAPEPPEAGSNTGSRTTRRRIAPWKLLPFLLGLIPWFIGLYLCERYTPPVPAGDQWGQTAANVIKGIEQGVTFADFNAPWNHGRMTVPRLITYATARLTGYDLRWEPRQNVLGMAGVSLCLLFLLVKTLPDRPLVQAGIWLISNFLVFNPLASLVWIYGATNVFVVQVLFSFLALTIIFLHRLPLWLRLALAGLFAWLALYSHPPGLLPWMLVLPAIFLERLPHWRKALLPAAAWLIVAGVVYGFYFANLTIPEQDHGSTGGILANLDLAALLQFFFTLLGVVFSINPVLPKEQTAPLVSIVFLSILAALLLWRLRWLLDPANLRRGAPWLLCIAYGLGSSALVSLGRYSEPGFAFMPRYLLNTLPFYVGLFGLAALLITNPDVSRRVRIGLSGIAGLLLIFCGSTYVFGFQAGLRHIQSSYLKTIAYKGAMQFMRVLPDHELLGYLGFSGPDEVLELAPRLDDLGLLDPPLPRSLRVADLRHFTEPTPVVQGKIRDLRRKDDGSWELRGWAVKTRALLPADLVMLSYLPEGDKVEKLFTVRIKRRSSKRAMKALGLGESHLVRRSAGWSIFLEPQDLPGPLPGVLTAWAWDTARGELRYLDSMTLTEADFGD